MAQSTVVVSTSANSAQDSRWSADLRRLCLFVSDWLLGSIWIIFVNAPGLSLLNLRNMNLNPSTQTEFQPLKSGYRVMKA
jgi:hypothetical protein